MALKPFGAGTTVVSPRLSEVNGAWKQLVLPDSGISSSIQVGLYRVPTLSLKMHLHCRCPWYPTCSPACIPSWTFPNCEQAPPVPYPESAHREYPPISSCPVCWGYTVQAVPIGV